MPEDDLLGTLGTSFYILELIIDNCIPLRNAMHVKHSVKSKHARNLDCGGRATYEGFES